MTRNYFNYIAGSKIEIGDDVRISPSVTMHTFQWGGVTQRSIGTVKGNIDVFFFISDVYCNNSCSLTNVALIRIDDKVNLPRQMK